MKNGRINVKNSVLTISSSLSENEFLSSDLGRTSTPLIQNGVYRSYEISVCCIAGDQFLLDLFFESGEIKTIHLSPTEIISVSNDDLEALRQTKLYNDRWLYEKHGLLPKNHFPWGSVISVLDEKSWNACIVVHYESKLK
jgi:hypothetical protein